MIQHINHRLEMLASEMIKKTIITLLTLLCSMNIMAQEVTVTVTPKSNILPPQLLLYAADPSKFFTITLTNLSAEEQMVYLAFTLEQTSPASSDLSVAIPADYLPEYPFMLGPSGSISSSYTLSTKEMKNLFNHIPSSAVKIPQQIFDGYENGSFGLLPEGDYMACFTAYKWNRPKYPTPVVVSNPASGKCNFTVCYSAKAPEFITPIVSANAEEMDVAELNALSPTFTWTEPIVSCNPKLQEYNYSIRIVKILDEINQTPDEAMQRNPAVVHRNNLSKPTFMLTPDIINKEFKTDGKYVAQVTAYHSNGYEMNYVQINNEGKSPLLTFRLKTSDSKKDDNSDENKEDDKKKDDDDKGDDDKKDEKKDYTFNFKGFESDDSLSTEKLYSFSNPKLVSPAFHDPTVSRKHFINNDIAVKWEAAKFRGGEGLRQDTLRFDYEVQLFNNGMDADREAAALTEPIYTKRFTAEDEMSDSIKWDVIKDKVNLGDYLFLRVQPVPIEGKCNDVAFLGDSLNCVDFGLYESLLKKYFQCSNKVNITNTLPTKKTADELKGKKLAIGEFEVEVTEIKKGDGDTFSGKGIINWNPMGMGLKVHVKFDKIKINTDGIIYDGICEGDKAPEMTGKEIVDQLFSDWGVDELIASTNVPYASMIQDKINDKGATALADFCSSNNINQYYNAARNLKNLVANGDMYFPAGINQIATDFGLGDIPIDVQINSMKFAPGYAIMDLIGEYKLPETSYTSDQTLVFGAPRICISPESLLPESGTIALLSDFTVKNPDNGFDITFKASENKIEPDDNKGTFVSWKDYKFELLDIEVEMEIPKLLKEDLSGNVTEERPKFYFHTRIADWDDFLVEGSIDKFQAEDLPGWTFEANSIIYDHSVTRNSEAMESGFKFPVGYDRSLNPDSKGHGDEGHGETWWKGMYIKSLQIYFPKMLSFGDGDDKRLKLAAQNFMSDVSGITCSLDVNNVFEAKTGKLGGWKFSIDDIGVNFVQSKFDKCYFKGAMGVPLMSEDISYRCDIVEQLDFDDVKKKTGKMAYIFATYFEKDETDFDFFLAKAKFNKATYFLLEAEPDAKGEMQTSVELCMSGVMEIGCKEFLTDNVISKMPMKFSIPDVHFTKLRISNRETFKSRYTLGKSLQEAEDNSKAKNAMLSVENKTYKLGENCYFSRGEWSLASLEKELGPFKFTLDDYGVDLVSKTDGSPQDFQLSLGGKVTVIEDFSGSCTLTLHTKFSGFDDLSNLSLEYDSISVDKLGFGAGFEFGGMKIKGELEAAIGGDREGFSGELTITMVGDLFETKVLGGFFKENKQDFNWGFFDIKVETAVGIQVPPLQINGIHGGFYFNCGMKDPKKSGIDNIEAKDGVIGVVAGLSIASSAGKDVFNGDFDLTVVYDKNEMHFSTIMLNGNVSAMKDVVKGEASLVYTNNDKERYFALNITVDVKTDPSESLLKDVKEATKELTEMKQKLNSDFKEVAGTMTGGLADKFGDSSKEKSTQKDEKKDDGVKVSGPSAHVAIDIKITKRKDGVTYDKAKWHVYLGEPEKDKRCSFTFVDIKTGIVDVYVGADAYLCIGNELPNDGELPPIPSEIAQFLDGSTKGSGVQSDDMNAATTAREKALRNVKTQGTFGGGVMLGASVTGKINVDLGLLYGDLKAIAGFDISITNREGVICRNLSGGYGYYGWYGEGQLYAYLAAKLGVHINLGFIDKKIDIINAGIGGVLKMGMPNPSYFEGKARVKLSLLGGLVNLDKKFAFDCGQRCDAFYGNALDDFKMFGDLSIGDTLKADGWKKSNAIDPHLVTYPILTTEAGIDQHYRVIDQTELHALAEDYDGDMEDLETEAQRTFVFHIDGEGVDNRYVEVKLERFRKEPGLKDAADEISYYTFKKSGPFQHTINMPRDLKPNSYYRLSVSGHAKEIYDGYEMDPEYFDVRTNRTYNKPWKQTQVYYFCTGETDEVDDAPDLQEYVAIAYPSNYNELKDYVYPTDYDRYMPAHENDVTRPTIALTKDVSKSCFKKGNLRWRLCDEDGKELVAEDNAWVTNNEEGITMCSMEPVKPLLPHGQGVLGRYILRLDYVKSTQERNDVIVYDTLNIVLLHCNVQSNSSWRTGYRVSTNGGYTAWRESAKYEAPFMASLLVDYKYTEPDIKGMLDKDFMESSAKTVRTTDPFVCLSYLGNYAFVGGWNMNSSDLNLEVITSQSLNFTIRGGKLFEGTLSPTVNDHRIRDSYNSIKSMVFYDKYQRVGDSPYPLPNLSDSRYDYVLKTNDRASRYYPNQTEKYFGAKNDIDRVFRMMEEEGTDGYYGDRDGLLPSIRKRMMQMELYNNEKLGDFRKRRDMVRDWRNARRGMYINIWSGAQNAGEENEETGEKAKITGVPPKMEIPLYQFPVLWGSTRNNDDLHHSVTMYGVLDAMYGVNDKSSHRNERATQSNSQKIFNALSTDKFDTDAARRRLTEATFITYRVNAFDIATGEYYVTSALLNGSAMDTWKVTNPLLSGAKYTSESYASNVEDYSTGNRDATVKEEHVESQAAMKLGEDILEKARSLGGIYRTNYRKLTYTEHDENINNYHYANYDRAIVQYNQARGSWNNVYYNRGLVSTRYINDFEKYYSEYCDQLTIWKSFNDADARDKRTLIYNEMEDLWKQFKEVSWDDTEHYREIKDSVYKARTYYTALNVNDDNGLAKLAADYCSARLAKEKTAIDEMKAKTDANEDTPANDKLTNYENLNKAYNLIKNLMREGNALQLMGPSSITAVPAGNSSQSISSNWKTLKNAVAEYDKRLITYNSCYTSYRNATRAATKAEYKEKLINAYNSLKMARDAMYSTGRVLLVQTEQVKSEAKKINNAKVIQETYTLSDQDEYSTADEASAYATSALSTLNSTVVVTMNQAEKKITEFSKMVNPN